MDDAMGIMVRQDNTLRHIEENQTKILETLERLEKKSTRTNKNEDKEA